MRLTAFWEKFWNKKRIIRYGHRADQFFSVDAKLWDAFEAECRRRKKDPLKVLPKLIEKRLRESGLVKDG